MAEHLAKHGAKQAEESAQRLEEHRELFAAVPATRNEAQRMLSTLGADRSPLLGPCLARCSAILFAAL